MDDDRDPPDEKESLRQAAKALRSSLNRSQEEVERELGMRRGRISEIETGGAATFELVRELAEGLRYRTVHVVRSIELFELLAEDRGRPFDPIGPTPEQEVSLHRAAKALGDELGAIFRERIRRENLKRALASAAGEWKRIARLAPSTRQAEVRRDAALHTWEFCLYLCGESVRQATDDPKEAIHVGRLVVVTARCCADLAWRDRLVAYALAHLANAWRVLGRHGEAEKLFAQANVLWNLPAAAKADPGVLDPGRIYDLEASLKKDQRKLAEALELLEQAFPLSRVPGRILVSRSIVLSLKGAYEEAITTLRRAATFLVDPEPRDRFVLSLNTGVNLCHLSKFDEASVFADVAFGIAVDSNRRVDILRCRWLRARVLAGHGNRPAALRMYQRLLSKFQKLEMHYDLALITLELAALLLSLGRARECRSLVVGLPAYFEAKGIHQEALAAIRVFCHSVNLETATEALARQVAAFLYLAQANFDLRFVPSSS